MAPEMLASLESRTVPESATGGTFCADAAQASVIKIAILLQNKLISYWRHDLGIAAILDPWPVARINTTFYFQRLT